MSGSYVPPMMPVSAPDSADNRLINDVIGQKGDTVAGTSLYSRALQALAASAGAIPAQDSPDNLTPADVIGNKTDTPRGNIWGLYSLMNFSKLGFYHVHAQSQVYPTLATPVLLTSAAGAWGWGAWTEIIPAAGIANDFDIHWCMVSDISATDYFELSLASGLGGAEVEIGRIAFHRNGNFVQEGNLPIQVPVQDAGNRISARIACGAGGLKTCRLKVYYHIYP